MKLISVNCPNCGKSIDLDIDNLRQFCSSCGSKIVLDVETIQQLLIAKEETKRTQMNVDKQLKLAQMHSEAEAQKWKRQEITRNRSFMRNYGAPLIIIGVVLLSLIIGLAWSDYSTDHMFDDDIVQHESIVEKLEDIEDDIEDAIEDGDYDRALILANKLRMDDGWSSEETKSWNEKREEYIRIINERKQTEVEVKELEIPFSSKYAKGKNYEEIVKMLKEEGFTNISLTTLEDDAIIFKKTNEIERIAVDGRSTFDEGAVFKSTVKITVYYYE